MPMKTIEGYSKEKYTNTSVLLAGGGAKALSDFIGSLSWDSTNKKIKYTPVEGSTTDLVTLSWDNIANKPTSMPANGGDADTSNRAKFLETFQQNSTTTTYGAQYPIWAQWSDNSNVRLKCTNYTVWTDKANYANNAGTTNSLGSGALKYMCSLYATNTYNAYKITTDWHKSSNIMPTINIRGYAYGTSRTIDCDIVMYHYNNDACSYSLTNKGSYSIRVWQAIENDVQVFYINPGEYFGMFNVFVYGGMGTDTFSNWSMTTVDEVSGTEIESKPIVTSITGNASTSSTWKTSRTITLTGSVTGSVSIDGSANVSLVTTTNHTHTKSQITDFPTSLPANGGNADTVDNEHASAFAHIGAHNNLTASGNEFTFASSGFNGNIWINYRTAGGLNGNITSYQLGNGKGDSLGYILTSSNWSSYISIPSVGNGTVTVTQAGNSIGSFTMNQSGNTLIALNDTNTNYYPIRSYTTGLQISSYSGSTDCALFVPYATDKVAGSVSTAAQSFAGQKTFLNGIKVGSISGDQSTDNAKIYFGNSKYVWIGESPQDDALMLNCGTSKNIYFSFAGSTAVTSSNYSTYAKIYMSNSGAVYASSGFYESSDERLKKVVDTITVNLDDLAKLRKIYYLWNNTPEDGRQLGMIAQDVQKLYPELVSMDKNTGYLSLAYDKLSVIALEAIDTLYEEYKQLKERMNGLEKLLHNKEIL